MHNSSCTPGSRVTAPVSRIVLKTGHGESGKRIDLSRFTKKEFIRREDGENHQFKDLEYILSLPSGYIKKKKYSEIIHRKCLLGDFSSVNIYLLIVNAN